MSPRLGSAASDKGGISWMHSPVSRPSHMGDSACTQRDPSITALFVSFPAPVQIWCDKTVKVKTRFGPCLRGEICRMLSTDTISASCAERLSLTFMSLDCVTHPDPACPPARPHPGPFSPCWYHSAQLSVAEARVSCNLSLPIKVTTDTTCPESLTQTHCRSTSGSFRWYLYLFSRVFDHICSILSTFMKTDCRDCSCRLCPFDIGMLYYQNKDFWTQYSLKLKLLWVGLVGMSWQTHCTR